MSLCFSWFTELDVVAFIKSLFIRENSTSPVGMSDLGLIKARFSPNGTNPGHIKII